MSDISFDDRYIISSSKDGSIRIWSSSTFQPIRMIVGHNGPVNAIQLKGDYLVSASSDAMIKLWEVSTGNLIREFAGHKHGLACVQYDGKRIVSGSNDHTIRVWDVEVTNSSSQSYPCKILNKNCIADRALYHGI